MLAQALSEVRAIAPEEEGADTEIEGKGIVFNQRSEKLGFFYEYIEPEAIQSADTRGIISLFNHDGNYVLGNSDNRTLTLEISKEAVIYRVKAPGTQTIRDLVLSPIVRGDVRGSSFMFSIARGGDDWDEQSDGTIIRYVKKIERVYEMGPVTMPAYSQTTTDIAKRSFDDWIKEFRKQEEVKESYYKRQIARMQLDLIRI